MGWELLHREVVVGLATIHAVATAGHLRPGDSVAFRGQPRVVHGFHIDPLTSRLFLAFATPYRITHRMRRHEDLVDPSVAAARADFSASGQLLALEIKPHADQQPDRAA